MPCFMKKQLFFILLKFNYHYFNKQTLTATNHGRSFWFKLKFILGCIHH